jgi:hypothetical protein
MTAPTGPGWWPRRDAGETRAEYLARVLFTGSRDLRGTDDEALIRRALTWVLDNHPRVTVLVHGAQTSRDPRTGETWGGDHLAASTWAALAHERGLALTTEPHPARWRDLGRTAGPARPPTKGDAGATVCVTVARPASRGPRDCAHRARTAGIPVHDFAATTQGNTP